MRTMRFLLDAVRRRRRGGKRHTDVEKSGRNVCVHPRKVWAETRNFLYYDGTVMPEIKEDLHEQ